MEKQGYLKKLYFKQWVLGLTHGDIKEIIRTKNFRQDDIRWISPGTNERFFADPFIIPADQGNLNIMYEDFSINQHYGNISVLSLDNKFNVTGSKVLLDTGRHLSFPFIFNDEGRLFVIPESVKNNRVSCYEYYPGTQTLGGRRDLIKMPLYDPVVLKMNDRYWLFGSEYFNRKEYYLHIFNSNHLFGPYIPLPGNPVRKGLNGIRSAGNFIEVDGFLYRPAQNCENAYGESITINRIKVLDEFFFSEEPYMTISISKRNMQENNIHTIHTLNFMGDVIVVDGMKWTFSLKEQWKNFRRNRRLLSEQVNIEP